MTPRPARNPRPQSTNETKGDRGVQSLGRPAVEERPDPEFFLPWTITAGGEVVNARDEVVVDPMGTGVWPHRRGVPVQAEILTLEADYMRHIVACVNACEGLTTAALESCAGLIARVK